MYYWLSTTRMTVGVEVNNHNNIIINGPPIVRKFIGQNIINLIDWMKKQPGFKYESICIN